MHYLNEKIHTLSELLVQLNAKTEHLQSENEMLKTRCKELTTQYGSLKQQHESEVSKMNAYCHNLQQTLNQTAVQLREVLKHLPNNA
ncbi:MAG: hypothetical protein IJR44_01630 [Neisseriaceae bacterium]|nr:hypothetical protein [Neisseriaceae bacterium]